MGQTGGRRTVGDGTSSLSLGGGLGERSGRQAGPGETAELFQNHPPAVFRAYDESTRPVSAWLRALVTLLGAVRQPLPSLLYGDVTCRTEGKGNARRLFAESKRMPGRSSWRSANSPAADCRIHQTGCGGHGGPPGSPDDATREGHRARAELMPHCATPQFGHHAVR
jgi:hypothetical protein